MDMDSEQLISFVNTVVFHETQRHLRDVEVFILKGAWNGHTYEDIAERHSYTARYLSQDIGPKFWKFLSIVFKEEIKKSNFRTSLERHFINFISQNASLSNVQSDKNLNDQNIPITRKSLGSNMQIEGKTKAQCDWGEAPDIAQFLVREPELKSIDLILNPTQAPSSNHRCRLMSLLGMAGIGKTGLLRQVAQRLSTQFDFIIWRSLRNTPEASSILKDWLQFLCPDTELPQSATFSQQILHVLDYLRQYRCLLILDNFDSVLEPGSSSGAYQPHFEEYGILLRHLADADHQSCLLLTSRIRPKGLMQREGSTLPVRSFGVPGLQSQAIAEIFKLKGCHGFEQGMVEDLTTYYGGNPLFLNNFAAMVQELEGGNIADFLSHLKLARLHFSEADTSLHQQMSHLATFEKQLMGHIASCSDGMTLPLLINALPKVPKHVLVAGVQSLLRRSLIAQKGQTWLMQPYIKDYTQEYFRMELNRNKQGEAQLFLSTYNMPEAS
jgi:hypothetical protein